ncbi:hypothetical protein GGS20DRAFT_534698 [Poronia punctata]|nr:hypothetical protein GGS20DRAFT_534698 [Poronia punctata]
MPLVYMLLACYCCCSYQLIPLPFVFPHSIFDVTQAYLFADLIRPFLISPILLSPLCLPACPSLTRLQRHCSLTYFVYKVTLHASLHANISYTPTPQESRFPATTILQLAGVTSSRCHTQRPT